MTLPFRTLSLPWTCIGQLLERCKSVVFNLDGTPDEGSVVEAPRHTWPAGR